MSDTKKSTDIIATDLTFAGLPVIINPYMPEGEVWMIVEGQEISIYVHEGQQAGETLEE
jgi:hypothetical protein